MEKNHKMNHNIDFVDSNIVIIASTFNVNILNTVWLYKNKIFTEKELQGATCLPVVVEVQSDDFRLHIIPDRLQFSINTKYKNAKELLLSKIGGLIKLLPHTPFTAAGLNFTYHVTPSDKDMNKLSRSLFCNEKSILFDNLEEDNVRFGGYFSKDLLGTRFKLDAKPISVAMKNQKKEMLQLAYNFNISLTQDNDQTTIKLNLLETKRLRHPLDVIIEEDDEGFIARTVDFSLFGCGDDRIEAVDALKFEIESLYFDLLEDDNFTEEWLNIKIFLKELIIDS